jgi:hypothetical protein
MIGVVALWGLLLGEVERFATQPVERWLSSGPYGGG